MKTLSIFVDESGDFGEYEIPSDYRLFQVADLICTLKLLKIKSENQPLSNSEKLIFHSKRDLKKDFLKGIKKKEFDTI